MTLPRPTGTPTGAPTVAPTVLVVGSGWRFTSGISYYTCRLANALARRFDTDALLMRRLVPRALYPGKARVGQSVNEVDYDAGIDVFDGVDWYWGTSMRDARRFLDRERPDVMVLQWWTGAVLHSYLALVALARRRGVKVVMEWHEVQDTGEARVPFVTRYVKAAMGRLLRGVDAHVVHSRYDLDLLRAAYDLSDDVEGGVSIVPHGPYDHVTATPVAAAQDVVPAAEVGADRPFTLLFFGIIRPYKGLEDLVEAFGRLPREVSDQMRLQIVGETWEGWDAPLTAVAESPVRDRITVDNQYVTDAEARRYFAEADAVVLPYRRSSSSGPLHMAMSAGLPTVVTEVGGLVDAASGYEGVTFVPVADVDALTMALAGLLRTRGHRYADPHSWDTTVEAYARIFERLGLTSSSEKDSVGSSSHDGHFEKKATPIPARV